MIINYECHSCSESQSYEVEQAVLVSLGESVQMRVKCPNCGSRNTIGNGVTDHTAPEVTVSEDTPEPRSYS